MARVHPGDLVGDRYLVFDQTDENWGVCAWRARDEVLGREVLLTTFHPDDPRTQSLVAAAQSAAAVHDHRFVRVLDAHVDRPTGYLVREWVGGRTLTDLLTAGPLDEGFAAWLVVTVADALEQAHAHGLSHLCLDPNSVVIDDDGAVRVKGLGTAAVLRGVQPSPAGAVRDDTEGLGVVLYAALTGMLPRPASASLPVVRRSERALPSPRQVRAGVSVALSSVAMQALGEERDVFSSPGQVAAAVRELGLDERAEPRALSLATSGAHHHLDGRAGPSGQARVSRPALDPDRTGSAPPPPPEVVEEEDAQARSTRRWLRRALVAVAVALSVGVFLLGLDLLAANRVPELEDGDLATTGQGGAEVAEQPVEGSSDSEVAAPGLVPVVSTRDYDPYGNRSENSDRTDLAVDGDVGTLWPTQTYYDPLELQKPGVGLLLDLGAPTRVSSVDLVLSGSTSDVSVLTTSEDELGVPPTPDGFEEFGTVLAAPDAFTVSAEPVQTRFVLVWFTRLPQSSEGWRGGIAEAVVRG